MSKPTRITNSIRALRFAHGEMTQAQLAERVGVTPPDDYRHRAGPLLTLAGDGLPDRPGVPGAARRGVPVSRRRRRTAVRASMATPQGPRPARGSSASALGAGRVRVPAGLRQLNRASPARARRGRACLTPGTAACLIRKTPGCLSDTAAPATLDRAMGVREGGRRSWVACAS